MAGFDSAIWVFLIEQDFKTRMPAVTGARCKAIGTRPNRQITFRIIAVDEARTPGLLAIQEV
jgi:hypothetical protein